MLDRHLAVLDSNLAMLDRDLAVLDSNLAMLNRDLAVLVRDLAVLESKLFYTGISAWVICRGPKFKVMNLDSQN